jgi:hypothetical protein
VYNISKLVLSLPHQLNEIKKMAQRVILESGLISIRLSKAEQDKIWKELDVDVSVIGTNQPLYTPRDKLQYFIDSETKLKYDSYVAEIRANGKIFKVKYNICNQDLKINEAVRKAYGFIVIKGQLVKI